MTRERKQLVGPDMVVDLEYASAAHVAPAVALYVQEHGGRLDTAIMRQDLREALAALERASGRDNDAWLNAAAKIAALGWLLVYVRTSVDAAQGRTPH